VEKLIATIVSMALSKVGVRGEGSVGPHTHIYTHTHTHTPVLSDLLHGVLLIPAYTVGIIKPPIWNFNDKTEGSVMKERL
jgi:hypothetical protein